MAVEMMYDFYYSKKQEKELKKDLSYVESFFKGKLYTQMIEKGRKTASMKKYKDLVKVGTGVRYDISF